MNILESTNNPYGGIVVDPQALPAHPDEFRLQLQHALNTWTDQGGQVVWLEIPISKSTLIPIAVEAGFVFHHSHQEYLMLTFQLAPEAFIPPYATHYIGAGGVVFNDRQELLVVWEKSHRTSRPHYYKLPGGTLHQGEHLVDGVIREIREETGVITRFESLVCFRHWHGYRYGKSDIYFVCRLSPLTLEITASEAEIEESLWMPVDEFLAHEQVGVFNKRIVQAARDSTCDLVPSWIDGYQVDPHAREVFLPHR